MVFPRMVFPKPVKTALNKLAVASTLLTSALFSGLAQAEYRLNFQDPVTSVAREIYDLHMLIFWICVVIFVVVFGFMFYSIFAHRKSKNYEAAQFSHSTKVEVIWTVIPSIILVLMAWPATLVLIDMEDTTMSDLTIKITGYQWKWGYEYLDSDISFYSTLATPREQIDQFDEANAVPPGENYLLEVDNYLVVPSGRKVRALITANDVIHAWWIPAFGTKKDAIPGYINELWFNVDEGKEGLYRGQCAELCGKDHAFMPIVAKVVTGEEFDNWVASGGTSFAADAIAEAVDGLEAAVAEVAEVAEQAGDAMAEVVEAVVPAADAAAPEPTVSAKTWTKDELMEKGAAVYQTRCQACHGPDGKGLPGAFPAIAGSEVVMGDRDAQIDLVMFGKAGTAMAAFAGQLSDEEMAGVLTYQRNAFGNNVGDVVLPADIKAKR
ncbi:MAG: cytochrome c oxidase subunit II [Gammaproteobacteria bacterium]|nr:cytochrome c oxidase subunit II [Gammaproteobacteria bacterium]